MLTVYLCDGDPRAIHAYSDLIMRTANKYKVPIVLSTFESGETLLFHLGGGVNVPDIIYLDVTLPGKNGIETAREVRAMGCEAQIVFNASTPAYVFDAFDVLPVNYLLKGEASQAKFEKVFLRARDLVVKREGDAFTAENGPDKRVVVLRDIRYFEIKKHMVTMHYGEGSTFNFWDSMEALATQLASKDFIRVHRSYLVNAAYIAKFRSRSVALKTGEVLPFGATHAEAAKAAFARYAKDAKVYA